MSAVPTSAYVEFGPKGALEVRSSVHMTGDTWRHCCLYPDRPPILAIDTPIHVPADDQGRNVVGRRFKGDTHAQTWKRVLVTTPASHTSLTDW